MIRAPCSLVADVPILERLLVRAYERSKYPAMGVTVNRKALTELATNAIMLATRPGLGSTFVRIAEENGIPVGLIIGAIGRIYDIGEQWGARAAYFFVQPGSSPRIAMKLVDAFLEWAFAIRKVVMIGLDWSDTIEGGERVAALFRRKGFVKAGESWERAATGGGDE